MMQKYLGSSIENKKVDSDCDKSESVHNLFIKEQIPKHTRNMSEIKIFSQLLP